MGIGLVVGVLVVQTLASLIWSADATLMTETFGFDPGLYANYRVLMGPGDTAAFTGRPRIGNRDFGFTLNTMSLLGLSLAIGILIDDAIVVRENIVRHVHMGKDHYTAAREGTAEIGLAVAATTFSIVAVFVPIAFMEGEAGQWFKPFALTIACSVLVSLFVSFSLDPMLSAYWPDPELREDQKSFVTRLLDRFNRWFKEYDGQPAIERIDTTNTLPEETVAWVTSWIHQHIGSPDEHRIS